MKSNIFLLLLIFGISVSNLGILHAQENEAPAKKLKNKHKHRDDEGAPNLPEESGGAIKKAFVREEAKLKASQNIRPVDTPPAITVDESNFNSIYTSNLQSKSDELRGQTSKFEMEVQGRYLSVQELRITNPTFAVDYHEGKKNIPMIQFGGGLKLFERNRFSIASVVSGGYGFKEERLSATTRTGTRLVDIVGLHVVPITLGAELKQGIFRWTSVFATPQVGTLWLRQAGSLDGMEQNRWFPFYGLRAGLGIFRSESRSAISDVNWFDGITASWTIQRTTGRDQKMDSTSVDVGLRFLL